MNSKTLACCLLMDDGNNMNICLLNNGPSYCDRYEFNRPATQAFLGQDGTQEMVTRQADAK